MTYRLTEERAMQDARRLADEMGKPYYVRYDFAGTQDRWYVTESDYWGSVTRATKVEPRSGQ